MEAAGLALAIEKSMHITERPGLLFSICRNNKSYHGVYAKEERKHKIP